MWQIYPSVEQQFHRFWFLFWQLIFGWTRCGRSTPVEQQFHRFWFLLWQLIFGRPGVADLPHPIEHDNFTDFDSYSYSSYLANQVWQIYPHPIELQFHRFWFLFWQLIFGRPGVADLASTPLEWQFHRFWFLFWQCIFGHTRCGRSTPVEQQFHRFWFLLWQLIFGRPGVADLPPPHRMAISQILIPILTAHIWQTRCGRSTPTPCRMHSISQILIPILTAHIWPTRCGRSTPVEQQFHQFWFLLWQLIFGRPGVADLPPPHKWQFHRFWFLLWQLIFGQTRCGRSTPTPCRMAISQILIPILTAHIWQTRCGRSSPCRTAISQILIPILTAHIWHQVSRSTQCRTAS